MVSVRIGVCGLEVLKSVGLVLHDLAVARHQGHHPGQRLLVDDVLHAGVHLVEAAGDEAHRLRSGGRQRGCGGNRGRSLCVNGRGDQRRDKDGRGEEA
jgi:hypothetical protein